MQFLVVGALLQLIAVTVAYVVTEGTVTLGSKTVHFGEIETREIKTLDIELPKDVIQIAASLQDVATHPHQLVVSLSSTSNKALATHYVPTFANSKLNLKIPVGKLPEVLKIQDSLSLDLIVADSKKQLYKHLCVIVPSEEFQTTSKYTEKPRIGYKPEIHHIFRADPETVNPIIPVVFIGGAVALSLALFGAWFAFVGPKALFSSFKSISSTQLTYNIGFLASLIGFEYTFIKYYLGQSIFTTLFNGAILSLPSIYFGSKVLRYLGQTRKAGKF